LNFDDELNEFPTAYTSSACATEAGAVYTRVSAYWAWIRQTSGLSLNYYDVAVNGNGYIRATDNTPRCVPPFA
jgi:secreted trypsin-like serine protease